MSPSSWDWQETVRRMFVIDEIPAFIELVTRSGRLPVASGAHIVDFPVAKNIIFHPEMLPRHENGMRITAWKGQEELLSKTYYSCPAAGLLSKKNTSACRTMSKHPYLTISTQQVNC
ncbi:L-serine dehydratase [Escherichia coli]|nr:L-serine dehydratase [Escherichia coli]